MFTDIYPIKRLPRRFGAFTYSVPSEVAPEVSRGRFVVIPWRGKEIRGVVARVHDEQPEFIGGAPAPRQIVKILPESMTESDLGIYEHEARRTFQSVSSLLDAALPPPRKRVSPSARKPKQSSKIASSLRSSQTARMSSYKLEQLKKLSQDPAPVSFIQVSDLVETTVLTHLLSTQQKGPILLLLPHQHDVDVACEILSSWTTDVRTCTSQLTEPQRHDLSTAWQRGEINLLVSTRLGALFLPPDNLGAIVVGRSGINEHAQYDRNPRYDARALARAWSRTRSCPLFLCDTLPRCADLHTTTLKQQATNSESLRFGISSIAASAAHPQSTEKLEHQWGGLLAGPVTRTHESCHVINLKERVQFGDDPLLTEPLIEQIGATLAQKKRILLICNQKGLAGKLTCGACDFVEVCAACNNSLSVYETHLFCAPCKRATKRPELCRKCGQDRLRHVRRGTGSLTKQIRNHWPEELSCIIEKEGSPPNADATILIATSFYYEKFYRPHIDTFGLVALPCADQEIRLTGDLGRASRRLLEYRGIAERHRCPLFVQTWDPPLVKRLLEEPLAVLEEECQTRKDLGQAPFVTEVELLGRGKAGLKELDRILKVVRQHPQTSLTQISSARWKILSDDAKLLQTLRTADDTLVLSNTTRL